MGVAARRQPVLDEWLRVGARGRLSPLSFTVRASGQKVVCSRRPALSVQTQQAPTRRLNCRRTAGVDRSPSQEARFGVALTLAFYSAQLQGSQRPAAAVHAQIAGEQRQRGRHVCGGGSTDRCIGACPD